MNFSSCSATLLARSGTYINTLYMHMYNMNENVQCMYHVHVPETPASQGIWFQQ